MENTVRVGILHSRSGTMALSERPLINAELMAIAEINQAGGVLGHRIEPIIEDGASEPAEFERGAKKLIQQDRVATVFGCWTSATRKAVKPIFEEFNALLWYPVQYEGLESSKNIFYSGSCPNQQVEPAVTWLLKHKGKRFYLIGSDYVFPHTANKVIKARLKREGGIVVGEEYISLGARDFAAAIARIKQARPDIVFSTVNGDSNQAFYRQYGQAGITAGQIPIMAVSVAEVELQNMGNIAVGHYCSWSYFQSLKTCQNKKFVDNFQAKYGSGCVTSDPIEAAYTQVYLWKQAVESAGSFDVELVRIAAIGQKFEAPGGLATIEPNQHIWKYCRIGQILANGQFEIVFSSDRPLKPLPWLGVEDQKFVNSELALDMLAEVSQALHKTWLVEQKTRELETTTARLQQEILEREQIEAQLRALFAAMTDVIIVYDRDGRCLKIARTNPNLLFKPVTEQLNKTLHEVLPKTQADIRLSCIQQALETRQAVTVEYSLTIGDRDKWFSANVSPLSEKTVIWVARDITERKLAEDALQNSFHALEKTNQDLANSMDCLQQAQLQLVQSEKMSALGQLVAGVAHEINNPITFIVGNINYAAQYIKDIIELLVLYKIRFSNPGKEIEQKIEDIELDYLLKDLPALMESMKLGTDRIRNISDSLRVFSRSDSSQKVLFDIHQGLDSTLMILKHRLKANNRRPKIKIIKHYGNLPLVQCYPGQLNQVFMNILSNSIDALEEANEGLSSEEIEGNPNQITILTQVSGDGDRIVIHIQDNGPGMPEKVKEQMFDYLFTTKPVGKGTGLGLSISREIVVARHGGSLKCESVLGEGTTFAIALPC